MQSVCQLDSHNQSVSASQADSASQFHSDLTEALQYAWHEKKPLTVTTVSETIIKDDLLTSI